MQGSDGDLLTGPYFRVLGRGGEPRTMNLVELLLDAHDVAGVDVPVRTAWPAMLRQLLLPVVIDALGGVPKSSGAWRVRFARARFSEAERERITSYLTERYSDRFRLFSAERPFAQVAGLTALSGGTKTAGLLVPSVATGNNVPIFSGFTEADELKMPAADALVWLLHTQCWDTAANKTGAEGDPQAMSGKTSGNPTGPLGRLGVVVPEGSTLYETLLLNTPIVPDGLQATDRPQWAADERPDGAGESPNGPRWSKRPARGLLDLLTFQSRRIRLFLDASSAGETVSRVIVAAGDRLTETPQDDPHTTWSFIAKPKRGETSPRPRRHTSGRAAWRGLNTLLAVSLPESGDGPYTTGLLRQIGILREDNALPEQYPLRVTTCGFEYGNMSAVVENAIADEIPVPVTALLAEDPWLREAVLECMRQADSVGRILDQLCSNLRRASGGEKPEQGKGRWPSQSFLYGLDGYVRRLLVGLRTVGEDEDLLEQAQLAWEQVVRAAVVKEAETLLAATSPRAVVGRMVKQNGKEQMFRSGVAVGVFYKQLDELLPLATEAGQAKEAVET